MKSFTPPPKRTPVKIPFEFISDGETSEISVALLLGTKDMREAKVRGRAFVSLLEACINADPSELQLFMSLKLPKDLRL